MFNKNKIIDFFNRENFNYISIPVIITILGIINNYFFILYIVILFIYRKLNLILCLILSIVVLLTITLYNINQTEIKGEVVVSLVEENNNINYTYIKYKNKNYYLSSSKNKEYNVGDKLYIDSSIKSYPRALFTGGYDRYIENKGKNIYGTLSVREVKLISKKNNNINIRESIDRYITTNIKEAQIVKSFVLFTDYKLEYADSLNINYLLHVSSIHIIFLFLLLDKFFFYFNTKKNITSTIKITIGLVILYLSSFSIKMIRILLVLLARGISKKLKLNLGQFEIIFIVYFLLLLLYPYLIYSNGFLISFLIYFFLFSIIDTDVKYPLLKKYYYSGIISIILLPSNQKISLLTFVFYPLFLFIIVYILFPISLLTLIVPDLSYLLTFFINLLNLIVTYINNKNLIIYLPYINDYEKLAYYIMFGIVFIVRKKLYKAINLLSLLLPFIARIYINNFNQNLKVTFLDCGQGDATIIREGDKVIVIDAFTNTSLYLHNIGIYKIDLLILTHPDLDHIKETPILLEEFNVRKVYINKFDDYSIFENELIFKYMRIVNYKEEKFNNLTLDFYVFDSPIDTNNNSLITLVKYKNYQLLFPGDIEKQAENLMLSNYKLDNITLLHVAHHGSNSSSQSSFINKINPKYSIISCGYKNIYKHPNSEVIKTLKNSNIFITSEVGSIYFEFSTSVKYKVALKTKKDY